MPMKDCAVCCYLRLEPRQASGTIGLSTAIVPLIELSLERLDNGMGTEAHILAPVCPEHVVDIYRGRLDGVAMAWRLALVGT